jgi:DUF177 domain-containing protein
MKVELSGVESKGGRFVQNYLPDELALNDERVVLAEPPVVAGKITRNNLNVAVEGELQARVQVECDRCLRPVELPVKTEFRLEYVTPEQYRESHAAELSEDELELSIFDGEVIDVDEIAREQLLLAVPSQVLCKEDCKGLCATCGTNHNLADCNCEDTDIDPRWSELQKLQERR